MRLTASFAALCAFAVFGIAAAQADSQPIEIMLHGAAFMPAEVKVPVGQTVKVKFKNMNDGPAEIESKALNIEKVVAGGGEIVVNVKAKKAGKVLFYDEYQEDVAKGYFIAE
jgi:hypothetical protein